jgi:hypothetical protein
VRLKVKDEDEGQTEVLVLTAVAFGVPVQGVQTGPTQFEKVVVADPSIPSVASIISENVLPAATGMEAVPV